MHSTLFVIIMFIKSSATGSLQIEVRGKLAYLSTKSWKRRVAKARSDSGYPKRGTRSVPSVVAEDEKDHKAQQPGAYKKG